MRRVMATLVVVLCMMGCEGDDSSPPAETPSTVVPVDVPPAATPAAALQVDFPQTPFNAVTGESPNYQATQVLSAQPQQNITSPRYVMRVSMF